MRAVCLFLFLLLTCLHVVGQKYVTIADEAFEADEYNKALNLYKSAYSKLADNPELKAKIAYNTGYCYRRIAKPDHAELWLGKSIELRHQNPVAHLYYADALRQNEKYEEAIEEYEKYKTYVSDDARTEKGLKSCKLALKWTENPTQYKVFNLVYLNSEYSDYAPSLADSLGLSMLFTSSREGTMGDREHGATGQRFADLYKSFMDETGRWSEPVPLDYYINSEDEEGASCFNTDYSAMIYTRCEFSEKKESTCKVFVSPVVENSYERPSHFKVSAEKRDTFLVAHPAISADGLRFYFASDLETGLGGYDIWYVERASKEEDWSKEPINAGPIINSKGNELYPYCRYDGVFFFSSDGHHGMGGLDLYRINKDAKGNDQLLNLMYPLNSPMDDFGITFRRNEERGYLSSSRKGTVGYDDIYQFSLPPLDFKVEGIVQDEMTNKPIAGANVRLIGNDGTSIDVETDSEGKYTFDLLPSTNYIVMASKKGYLNGKGKLTTDGVEESQKFGVNVYMTAIDIPVEIPNIMYDVAKWELRPESIVSLEKLVEILLDNPTITIEISSHTDYRTGRISNVQLSQKRAESVVDFLIAKGIDSERLTAKGYGATQPKKVSNKVSFQYNFLPEGTLLNEGFIRSLPSNQQETAHQINRRTEFRVLSTDYQE